MSLSLTNITPATENIEILSKRSQRILENIRAESENTLQVKWNTVTQTPELLTGNLTKPSAHSPGWITYRYLEKIKRLYGLKHVESDLKITTIDKSTSSTKIFLQRQLFRNPVCGNQLVVELDQSGIVQRINGTIHTGLEEKRLGRPMYPAISVEDAKRIASTYDASLKKIKPINEVYCYLPTRDGIPLVHVLTYKKDGHAVPIMIHSITGRVIEK
jgi:Zn-dependent metalloprotease